MPKPTQQGGAPITASQKEAETVDAGKSPGEADTRPRNPREMLFESIDAKLEEQRQQEHAAALAAEHPSAAGEAARAAERKAAEEAAVAEEADPEAAARTDAEKDDTGKEASPDPLSDFITEHEGQKVIKLKVDGQDRFITVDAARAQLQKHEAADLRLQQAAAARQQLETRAEQLRQQEAALQEREKQSRLPPKQGADDQALLNDAKELVDVLTSENSDVAAAKLTSFIAKARQAETPQVDANELVAKATEAAVKALDTRALRKDIDTGWTQFNADFPEIANDPKLFRYADGLTNDIAAEHPDWTPSQVMREAGKQTKEWVDSMRPAAPSNPTLSANQDRQSRKENLTPMPTARSAKRESAPKEERDSPQSIVAGMRKARGQMA